MAQAGARRREERSQPPATGPTTQPISSTGGPLGGTATSARPGGGAGAGAGGGVARPSGRCAVSGSAIEPGTRFHAAVRETPAGLERLDVLPEHWPAFASAHELLAHWVTTMPQPERAKKRLFVDDETLMTLFERLEGVGEPAKQRFRFVLGLVLMRKRLLLHEGQREAGGVSVWTVRLRGRETTLELVDPHLTQEQVGDVSSQLSEILETDL